jgi:membrane fusion protein (multidrug efflux system)
MKIDQPASLSPRREAHFSCLPSASRQGHRQQRWTLAVGAMLIAAALAGCSKPEAEQKGPLKSEPKVGVVTCSRKASSWMPACRGAPVPS